MKGRGGLIQFGPYSLDPVRFELRKHGVRMRLQRQPFKLLLLLIENRGEVVTRDRMRQEIWGDGTQVDFDRSLNFCISQIRAALGDEASAPKYIDTVHREGYRFIGDLAADGDPREGPALTEPTPQLASVAEVPAEPWRRARVVARSTAVAAMILLVAAITAGAWFITRQTDSAVPVTLSPLTGLAGRVRGPAFSPDGKQVAFGWMKERTGSEHIYVKLIGSPEVLQLTSGTVEDSFPMWTRDGKWIVFCRQQEKDAALWRVPALGGAAQRIGSLGARPLFEFKFRRPFGLIPSGGYLTSMQQPLAMRPPGEGRRIVRMREDGSIGAALSTPPKDWMGDRIPSVSPDGRWFAFVRGHSTTATELYVQPLEGGGASRQVLTQSEFYGVAWSVDGKSLIFSGEHGGIKGLWRVAVSGGAPRLIQATPDVPKDVAVAAQGGVAAYTVENPRVDLWRATLDGTEANPVISSAKVNWAPHLSTDGRKLTFYTDRSGQEEVWISNADGSEAHPLTVGFWPRWSPDSKAIAFTRTTPDGGGDIFVISTDGGTPVRITRATGLDDLPEWSSDGKWIYFSSTRSGRMEIWKTRSDASGAAMQVTRGGGFRPRVHDGYLYFRSRGNSTKRMPLEGGEEMVFGPEGSDHEAKPGGLYILLNNASQLVRVDYKTGQIHPVTKLNAPAAGFSISPDERWMIHGHAGDVAYEIMLAGNWPSR